MRKNHSLEAILFDLDGTLLDSFASHFEAYRRAFAKIDRVLTREEFVKTYAPNRLQMYESLSVPDRLWKEIDESWRAEIRELPSKLFPGVKESLKELGRYCRLGLVSSGSRQRIVSDLVGTGILSAFSVIVTNNDVESQKPHPEGLIRAMQVLSIEGQGAVYVGDTEEDYQMACAVGVSFRGIESEFTRTPWNGAARLNSIGDLGSKLGVNPDRRQSGH